MAPLMRLEQFNFPNSQDSGSDLTTVQGGLYPYPSVKPILASTTFHISRKLYSRLSFGAFFMTIVSMAFSCIL